MQIENEENVLVCLRIIIELHKQFRPPLQSEASHSINLCTCMFALSNIQFCSRLSLLCNVTVNLHDICRKLHVWSQFWWISFATDTTLSTVCEDNLQRSTNKCGMKCTMLHYVSDFIFNYLSKNYFSFVILTNFHPSYFISNCTQTSNKKRVTKLTDKLGQLSCGYWLRHEWWLMIIGLHIYLLAETIFWCSSYISYRLFTRGECYNCNYHYHPWDQQWSCLHHLPPEQWGCGGW